MVNDFASDSISNSGPFAFNTISTHEEIKVI